MIPHAPPMRFPIFGDRARLPEEHPLAAQGVFPALALIELAAQAAGHALAEGLAAEARAEGRQATPHAGMLVEIESAVLHRSCVPAGEVLTLDVRLERAMGPLRRYRVGIAGVLEVGLTLRIG